MKKKWYLQTWFIALLFFIAFFFIVMVPIAGLIILVVGIALIIIQAKDNKRLLSAYGTYDEIVAKTNKLEEDFSNKQIELEKDFSDKQEQLDDEYHEKESSLENQYKANWNKLSLKETEYTQQIDLLKQEISNLSTINGTEINLYAKWKLILVYPSGVALDKSSAIIDLSTNNKTV